MKLALVSQRIDYKQKRQEKRDALDQELIKFLSAVGFQGIPIPNAFSIEAISEESLHLQLSQIFKTFSPKAIVLSGGNDIGEYKERDLVEMAILDYAKEKKLPLLGICRGMQMMCYWEGVRLERVEGHIGNRHYIKGEISKEVNSFHAYKVVGPLKNYETLATSNDSVVEAIRHTSLPWEGWMWHPEREKPFDKADIKRAKTLFESDVKINTAT